MTFFSDPGEARNAYGCPRCGTAVHPFEQRTLAPALAAEASEGFAPMAAFPANVEPTPTASSLPMVEGFEILEELGRGGMGVVYAAWQGSLDRKVAIKVLSPQFARDSAFVQRFRNEARALATLDHPHVVRVIDQGQTGDHVYFIMDYIEGPRGGTPTDLRQWMDESKLDMEWLKRIALQICDGLQCAHERGIIHRDIKPANIMIDRHGNAKVTDFGIAAMSDSQAERALTGSGVMMGTLDYMAPEQRIDAASVDARADVYAMGVMLYEMLTSAIPDRGYEPPSELVEGLDPEWDQIISDSLELAPENRPASMRELNERISSLEFQRSCANCGESASEGVQFCPGCGDELWTPCAQCQAIVHNSDAFCGECGLDLGLREDFEQYMAMGLRELETAHSSDDLEGQVAASAQAGLAFYRAIQCFPDDPRAHEAQIEANATTVELAGRAAEMAEERNQLGIALRHYQLILDVEPSQPAVICRRDEILASRQDILANAQAQLDSGMLQHAKSALEAGRSAFAGDEELESLIAACEQRTHSINQSLEHVRELAVKNCWWRIGELLDELGKQGVPIKGLAAYRARRDEVLLRVRPRLDSALDRYEQGDYAEASYAAKRVLKRVADHPEALRILEASNERDGSTTGEAQSIS